MATGVAPGAYVTRPAKRRCNATVIGQSMKMKSIAGGGEGELIAQRSHSAAGATSARHAP